MQLSDVVIQVSVWIGILCELFLNPGVSRKAWGNVLTKCFDLARCSTPGTLWPVAAPMWSGTSVLQTLTSASYCCSTRWVSLEGGAYGFQALESETFPTIHLTLNTHPHTHLFQTWSHARWARSGSSFSARSCPRWPSSAQRSSRRRSSGEGRCPEAAATGSMKAPDCRSVVTGAVGGYRGGRGWGVGWDGWILHLSAA